MLIQMMAKMETGQAKLADRLRQDRGLMVQS